METRRKKYALTESQTGDAEGRQSQPAHFQSTFGLIVSCLGCMIGTGNIWRFPRIVANNSDQDGGLVFLLVWLLFLFFWSIPILVIEYGTGRFTGKAVLGSFRDFIGDNHIWCGAWVSMVTFCISAYYAVVLGWCCYYLVYYIGHELPENEDIARTTFKEFAEESYWPVLAHFCSVFLAGLCIAKGVRTIEKVSILLVPLLLLVILFTFVWSLTREYADVGIKFLFTPHWGSLSEPRLWVDAISQNAFDTGAGMGIMIPYSSYMTRRNGIVKYSSLIPTGNNIISLLCGITIFGTVFSSLTINRPSYTRPDIINIMKDSGPASTGLTFIWMPVLFQSVGDFGRVLAILFFLSLAFAGLTSLMSNFELVTHTLVDFGIPRKVALPLTIILTFSTGLPSSLDIDILTNQDFVWGFALVINGMMLMYMVLRFGIRLFRQQVVNTYSHGDWKLTWVWEVMIRVIVPIEAVALIVWWAYDLIDGETGDGEKWYEFGRETLVMTLVQWLGLMLVLILINVVYLTCRRRRQTTEIEPLLRKYAQTGTGSPNGMDATSFSQE